MVYNHVNGQPQGKIMFISPLMHIYTYEEKYN
jgi:hypothetical protein